MTPERVVVTNPVHSETTQNELSLLEKHKAEEILGRVQDELWYCGEIITIIDQKSETTSCQLQYKTTRNTVDGWGCTIKECVDWVSIGSKDGKLTINSDKSPTPLISLNPQDLSQEELEEQIYEIFEKDSDNRSFGKAMNLKLAAFGFGLEPNNSGRFNVYDDDPQLDIPNRS